MDHITKLEAYEMGKREGIAIDLTVLRDPRSPLEPFDADAIYVAIVEEMKRQVEERNG